MYINLSMWKVNKFQEKIGWCQAMSLREQFIAKWADLYLYLDLSFSTGLLDFYFSLNGTEKFGSVL